MKKPAATSRDPAVMGGAPVFPGTPVLIKTLLDYLEAGDFIDDFLAGLPFVSREQAAGEPLARKHDPAAGGGGHHSRVSFVPPLRQRRHARQKLLGWTRPSIPAMRPSG